MTEMRAKTQVGLHEKLHPTVTKMLMSTNFAHTLGEDVDSVFWVVTSCMFRLVGGNNVLGESIASLTKPNQTKLSQT
jgi:hypothetical protein